MPARARRLDDAPGIATIETCKAGIDQQRLARWRHDERGLSTLDVDEIDIERPARLGDDSDAQ
jgi:hypothetical protein